MVQVKHTIVKPRPATPGDGCTLRDVLIVLATSAAIVVVGVLGVIVAATSRVPAMIPVRVRTRRPSRPQR